jgi:hypothetical protein
MGRDARRRRDLPRRWRRRESSVGARILGFWELVFEALGPFKTGPDGSTPLFFTVLLNKNDRKNGSRVSQN